MIAEKHDAEQGQQSRISEMEMPNSTNARMCGMYARRSRYSRSIGVAVRETARSQDRGFRCWVSHPMDPVCVYEIKTIIRGFCVMRSAGKDIVRFMRTYLLVASYCCATRVASSTGISAGWLPFCGGGMRSGKCHLSGVEALAGCGGDSEEKSMLVQSVQLAQHVVRAFVLFGTRKCRVRCLVVRHVFIVVFIVWLGDPATGGAVEHGGGGAPALAIAVCRFVRENGAAARGRGVR